jgi:hypothetical protein
MIDILFLTHNRRKFTEASFEALMENTNLDLVSGLVVCDDRSADGTHELMADQTRVFRANLGKPTVFRYSVKFADLTEEEKEKEGGLGSPVAVMADYLASPGAQFWAKIDSDVIVPPGWLDQCAATFESHPELDLLGIEPPDSRCPHFTQSYRPDATRDLEMADGPPSYVPVSTIGGIGVFRRRAFERRPLTPHGKYGGFEAWQRAHTQVVRGQIRPALDLFLLDRLPVEPWASLSADYIAKGWQRPWRTYSAGFSHLWQWWLKESKIEECKPPAKPASLIVPATCMPRRAA